MSRDFLKLFVDEGEARGLFFSQARRRPVGNLEKAVFFGGLKWGKSGRSPWSGLLVVWRQRGGFPFASLSNLDITALPCAMADKT